MGRVYGIWRKLFGRYLWATNTLSCGVLLAAGDGIQQNIEQYHGVRATPTYNWARTGRLFVVGLILGPPHHLFYLWLDKILPLKTARVIGQKILIDQLVFAPFFAVSFFVPAGLLEGKSLSDSWKELKKKFLAVYAFDWCIWPPTQAINFYLIPAPYRVLYINFVTVIWDVFLSYMKHYDQIKEGNKKSD